MGRGADPQRALSVYIVGVAGLAILLLAFDLAQPPSDFRSRPIGLLIALLVVTVIAEHISFRVHRGWISAAATLPHLTAAFLLLPAHAELIGLLGAFIYGLSRHVALPKLVFNTAVVGLAVGAAAHVALSVGGPQLIEGAAGWMGPLVAVLASMTYYLISVATVAVVVALDQGVSPWPLARDKLGFLALADLGLGLTGSILAVVLITAPTWAPALLLPAVLVYLVKRSHERLTASEARLEAIIGSATDAIIATDEQRRIVVFNRAAEAMFGFTRNRVLAEPVGLVLIDDTQARRASGELFSVEMTRADVQVQGEHLSTLILRDITARQLAEEERVLLLESERAARLAAERATGLRDEFLLIAAHELRTPITSLRGYAQLMRRRLEIGDMEPGVLRRALEVVDQQSGKLARLISLLLDVSKIQAGSLELTFREVDLAPLVRQAVDAAHAGAPKHTIVLRGPEFLTLSSDPQRLLQVLNNLLENAIRFTPWGGAIEVDLTSSPDSASARLEVRDYGLGVSEEHREHLFDRFYRAHSASHTSGLGLGLHVSRYIVERHGGTIDVESPASGGTRFVVRLPVATPASQILPVVSASAA